MIRMCENGPLFAVQLEGADGGGGLPEITPLTGLAWRELRPCVAQSRQLFLLRSRYTL